MRSSAAETAITEHYPLLKEHATAAVHYSIDTCEQAVACSDVTGLSQYSTSASTARGSRALADCCDAPPTETSTD
eukprot:13635-Heterococcus_DN1.PRE.4